MRKLTSEKIGLIEYEDKDIIHFPDGLFGFENFKEFLLIKNNTSDYFIFLQSVNDPSLTFVLIQPASVMPEYVLDVDEKSIISLEVKHLLDFAIVTIPENPQGMMMNLLGPVLIDIKNQIGKQVISIHDGYTTKHKIFISDKEKQAI